MGGTVIEVGGFGSFRMVSAILGRSMFQSVPTKNQVVSATNVLVSIDIIFGMKHVYLSSQRAYSWGKGERGRDVYNFENTPGDQIEFSRSLNKLLHF